MVTSQNMQTRAVLFDLDGVLVDSMSLVERLLTRWARLQGLDPGLVLRTAHGRREADLVRTLAPAADVEAEIALMQHWQVTEFDGCAACEGAAGLTAALGTDRWAVVTSGSRAVATGRLRAAGLPVPRVLVTADDVANGKPHPEPYLTAAAALGLDAADCVVIEDAPSGAASGIAAGMRVIAVTGPPPRSADGFGDVHPVRSLAQVRVVGADEGTVVLAVPEAAGARA